jgi:3',5'-cyclic AMP phosphodiesterase CpdA
MYRAFLAAPGNGPAGFDSGLAYSFEYSDAFVGVLDSNLGLRSADLARRQAEWLDAALSKTRATWKFVMFHHPIYSSAPRRDNPRLRESWVPIFDRHGVDMVLQGHDHAYLRTYPMRDNRRVGKEERGTVYVVSVSGTKYYDQDPRDYTERGFTHTSTYQTLDFQIRGGRLTYRALDTNGREVDRLVIDK